MPRSVVIGLAVCLSATVGAQDGVGPGVLSHRVVHRFDFDERDQGNLEGLPKYWVALRPDGFPRFAHGRFDFEVGRQAPPSFYLTSEGRNVAYQYSGPDTRIHANSDYRVEGFIRVDRLAHARACLSAHFLDRHGRPILGTLVRSPYVGGPEEPAGWARVDMFLPSAPSEAFTIGLHAWVLQESTWNTLAPTRRRIVRRDVFGGAWFDDVSIYRLPRVTLTSSAAGNVLPPDRLRALWVLLADHNRVALEGCLEISDPEGRVLARETIPVAGNDPRPLRVSVDYLPPGLYHARMDALAGGSPIVSRRLTFALLGSRLRADATRARPFGVVVDPRFRADAATELALLVNQEIRSVKLPVWTGLADAPPSVAQKRATDRLPQELARSGFTLTGVFFGPPRAIVRADGAYPRPLFDFLNEPPVVWQEHLAAVVAPYASVFQLWQVGPDDAVPVASEEDQASAISRLGEVMGRFITVPLLSTPASAGIEPEGIKVPVEQLSVTLGRELHSGWFTSRIKRFKALGYERIAAFVQPLPREPYGRSERLADWAQRVVSARHGGADFVFVPQTWEVRGTAHGRLTEPTEEYLLLRTIADVLGGAEPGQRVFVAPGVHCLAFHDGEVTILAIWNPQAPPEGSSHTIQLGKAARRIDLWGRAEPLERAEDGRQVIRLSPMPILVDGIERWLIDLRTSLALRPAKVETGAERVTRALSLIHTGANPISGQLRLEVPESWSATPRSFGFNLVPQRTRDFAANIRYPHNAPAGTREILAKITLAHPPYHLEVPLSIELGLSDVDVRGMVLVHREDLVLRHVVTNRSSQVLNFRGSASVPGRERQYRPFPDLGPGDTQTVDYRISGGAGLVGSKVRLSLVELNDGPRRHNLELIVP